MAEPCSNGVQTHAAIDGLGGERVPKLVRGNVSNSRVCSLLTEDLGNPMRSDRTVLFDEEPVGPDVCGAVVCHPIIEELFELGMKGEMAIVVQLAERNRSEYAEPI